MIIIYIVFIIYLYNVFITFFAWKKFNNKIKFSTTSKNSFTILIPCHNEQFVIEKNLQALYDNDYDKKLYNVYVIADNCTDNTVNFCEKFKDSHKDFSLETIIVSGGSKPKALNCAVAYLKENNKWTDDNIVIIDADNKVSSTIFKTYDYYHNKGESILQCQILSDNNNSLVAKGFTSSFNTMAYGFQIARNRISLSASLCGTGFSVNRTVWDEVGFENCDTLTEDLEFTILSILKGYKALFVPTEYVLNQNLDHLKPSIIQRIRWCRGHMQVSVKLSKRILIAFFKKPSLQLFDSFLFVNTPSKSLIYILAIIFTLFRVGVFDLIPDLIALLIMIYNFLFILKCNKFKVKYLIPHIFFSLCMYFIIIYSAITYKNNKWAKTEHKDLSPA